MSFFPLGIHQNRCRLGLLPRPQWGSLQRSHRPPSWFQGAASRQEGMEESEELGEEREMEGKGGMGKGGERGSWWNSALVVGGCHRRSWFAYNGWLRSARCCYRRGNQCLSAQRSWSSPSGFLTTLSFNKAIWSTQL